MRAARWAIMAITIMGMGAWAPSYAATGFHELTSRMGFQETVREIRVFLHQHHVILVKVVNHSEMARRVGIALPPEELLIFGNPKVGARLMRLNPRIGIDLPMKALVWCQSASACKRGEVHVGFNRASYLARRYGISPSQPLIGHVRALFAALARKLTTG